MQTLSPEEFKKKYGASAISQFAPVTPQTSTLSNIAAPAKESVSALGTLYGGGDQGIANKLKTDVQQGASDISKGFTGGTVKSVGEGIIKGTTKAGARTAGDIANTIFAPVGAVLGATGINKVFDKVGQAVVDSPLGQKITDNKSVQDFAVAHPNAGEDFGRALNLALAGSETGKIGEKAKVEALPETPTPKAPPKTIEQMRADKIKQGFEEQNARLKTADRSFNKNTKTYTGPDGAKTTITPIDTFAKYNITPTVEKGGIDMGDYQQGKGALGKIKEQVSTIDEAIDKSLTDTGRGVPIEDFKSKAIDAIKNDDTLKQSGKVASTVQKVEGIFNDFKSSYGDIVHETDINNIRKTMNKDFHPDTVDVSRVIGDAAREIVYNSTPEQTVKTLLRQQGELLAAKKYAETINGTKVTGGRLGNMAMRTAGAVAGSTLHNLPVIGPLLGMVGGEYLSRAMQQTQFKSPIAEGKALLQRLKSTEPTANANNIPNKAIITEDSTPIEKPINYKSGYVKNPLGKAVPEGDRNSLINIIDNIRSKGKEGKFTPLSDENLLRDYGINTNQSAFKIANDIENLISKKAKAGSFTKGNDGKFTGSIKVNKK